MRDDLGLLKFGFAVLQESNAELIADSKRQSFELKQLKEILHVHGYCRGDRSAAGCSY